MNLQQFLRLVRIHMNLTRFLCVAQQNRDLGMATLISNEGHIIANQINAAIEQSLADAKAELERAIQQQMAKIHYPKTREEAISYLRKFTPWLFDRKL